MSPRPSPSGTPHHQEFSCKQLQGCSWGKALIVYLADLQCPSPQLQVERPEPSARLRRDGEAGRAAATYPLGLLVGEDARGSSSREVAVDFEGVPGAALVRVHPVFTWMGAEGT